MYYYAPIITFIEVVNRKSFAAAAAYFKITPAAVSKQIITLEKELGVQLLTRSTRRLDLTSNGLIYLEHAKKIIGAFHEAEAAISEAKREPAGLLKVVCGTHFGSHYITPFLGEFIGRYPKLALQIEYTQIMPDLEREKVDVVAGLSVGFPENWILRRLRGSRQVLCGSPNYLQRHGTPQKPIDLIHHRVITHTVRQPNNVISFVNGDSVIVNPVLYFNETQAMLSCALQGVGLVQLHDYIVVEEIKKGNLVEILQDFTEQKETIRVAIAYRQTTHVHVNVRTFVDFVVEKTLANLSLE